MLAIAYILRYTSTWLELLGMRYDHLHSELEKRGYELIKRDVQNGVVRRVVYDLDGEPSNIITFPLDREPNGIITVDDMIADAIVGRLKKQDAWK